MVFCSNGADVEEIRSGVFFLIQIECFQCI
jgi:hypothetical protein